jgi:hypothetical protein
VGEGDGGVGDGGAVDVLNDAGDGGGEGGDGCGGARDRALCLQGNGCRGEERGAGETQDVAACAVAAGAVAAGWRRERAERAWDAGCRGWAMQTVETGAHGVGSRWVGWHASNIRGVLMGLGRLPAGWGVLRAGCVSVMACPEEESGVAGVSCGFACGGRSLVRKLERRGSADGDPSQHCRLRVQGCADGLGVL